MRVFFILTLTISILLGVGSCTAPESITDLPATQSNETIIVDGRTRNYIQYLPPGWNGLSNMPVVFVLHGGTVGNPEKMMANADFRPFADEDQFMAIYPAGIANNWNDGRPTDANLLGVDDVKFFSMLIDKLVTEFSIAQNAVFVTGVSNGGFMSSRLGCELSNKIAAIGVVAATIEANTIYPGCQPTNNVAALYIHGTADTFVPIDGGEMTVGDGGFVVSHTEAINKWLSINNINTTPVVTNLPNIANDGTTITETRYFDDASSMEVVSYVILNGGHTWPQGTGPNYPNLVGIRSMNMNASQTIWKFFKKHIRQ